MFHGNINGRTNDDLTKEYMNIKDNVIALLTHADGTYDIHTTHNLITTDGADYYAELIENGKNATAPPTNDFITVLLGNPGSDDTLNIADNFSNWVQGTLLLTAEKTADQSKIGNTDLDNTGKGTFVFTWKFIWAGADFDTELQNDVRNGIITTASHVGTDPILNHWNFSMPFEKLSTSTLTLWVNHAFADDT